MRKTLQALVAAGTIGLASLLPMKKSEAQNNTISVFYGGGHSPIRDLTFNLHGISSPMEFEDAQVFGFRFGRRFYWDEKTVNPEWDIEAYIAQNHSKRINHGLIGGDTAGTCEFGETTYLGLKQCRELDDAVLRMASFALIGSVEVRPFQSPKLNRLAFYAGAGPFMRWSWFELLDETAERKNYGFEFQLGVRWRVNDETDNAEVFLEYASDKAIPNFSSHTVRNLITLNNGTNENFQRTYIGIRGKIF